MMMSNIKKAIITATLLGTIISLPVSAHTLYNNGQAHGINNVETNKRLLPVTASAQTSQVPDHFKVSAAVTTIGRDARETATQNAVKMSAIFSALKSSGLTEKDIKTTNISLRPRIDRSKKRAKVLGYEANNRISITHNDPLKIGDVIDQLVTAGADDIGGIKFFIKDTDALEEKIRDEAIQKARKKAQSIARSAGVTLGRLHSINVNDGRAQPQYAYDEIVTTGSGGGGAILAPVSQGEHVLRISVTLTYELP